jgi:hypothetical protein
MKNIFLLLGIYCFGFAKAQTPAVYETNYNNGLCSGTIALYADYNFFYESGCEASSRICFGKWLMKKDTVKLEPVNPRTFPVIKSVEATTVAGDSIWITILDKNGANMTAQISTGLEVAGRGSYMFNLDSSGNKKFVYKRNGGKIILRTLNKLFGQRLEIPADTANNFVITLNIPSGWISSTHADWGETNMISFLKKEGRLISTKPPKQIFTRSK